MLDDELSFLIALYFTYGLVTFGQVGSEPTKLYFR